MTHNQLLAAVAAVIVLAGTLVAGAATAPTARGASNCDPNPGARTSIVFVHGQDGDTKDFTDYGSAGSISLPDRLRSLPGTSISMFPYADAGHWVTDPGIGQKLADWVTCLAADSLAAGGSGKVIVITHSMGGLAIRQAATLTGFTTGMPTVNTLGLLITIAPPNTGSWVDGLFHDIRSGKAAGSGASTLTWLLQGVCGANHHNGALCNLVHGATSESGTAMVPGSPELAALAEPPPTVPLAAVAGQLTVTSTLFHHTYTVVPDGSVGDLLVKRDSALQYGTLRGNQQFLDQCRMSVHELWDTAGWGGCQHGGLLYDGAVGQHVFDWVKTWLASPAARTPVTRPTTTTTQTTVRQPPASSSLAIGSSFDSECIVAWPTAPSYTSQGVEMTMTCAAVPESQYLFTSVVYGDPNFKITPSTGYVRVQGKVVDVATSGYGFKELVVEANRVTIG
jgi:hypothetical protein